MTLPYRVQTVFMVVIK